MDISPSSVRVSETQAQTESVIRLVEISAGYWLPRALQVVADLAIADALDQEPRSAADLAKSVGVDADALDRVLRLLASHGVFDRRKGKYVHNALSRAVRSDKPAVTDIFAYFKGHPEETEIFDAGMKSKAQTVISPVLAAYDFSIFGTIGDIGGGLGHLLQAVLKSAPKLRGVLFDQPHVVERVGVDETIANRLVLQGGDFFRGP